MNKSTAETPLIVVFYIEVGDMAASDIHQFMQQLKNMVASEEGSHKVLQYFIPTRHQPHSRVECINPTMVSPDEYAKIAEAMGKLETIMAEFEKERAVQSDR